MKKLVKIAMIGLSLASTAANADGFAKLAAIYMSNTTGTGASKSEYSRTMYELNAAYVWTSGLALGAIYAVENQKSNTTTATRTSMGPSFGWITRQANGPYVMAHYLYSSEYEQLKGDGYQGDLGYKFSVGKAAIGLQVSYKSFTYNKSGSTKLNPPQKETKIDPYFVLLLEF